MCDVLGFVLAGSVFASNSSTLQIFLDARLFINSGGTIFLFDSFQSKIKFIRPTFCFQVAFPHWFKQELKYKRFRNKFTEIISNPVRLTSEGLIVNIYIIC